ncbi:transcription antitermination factor NusB [Paracraurococcus lichenis]|uniref:Transcription antitermination protein NusB n=1 Tax=Paracraurococcus lichenis TaxID=3064888 RepID=A0ABT9DUZ0_9PROT|nr:transcription antitermination factor NusB [Paracraurococcus sp. LOR1-02]MDO9707720.1 transcription antitermination factor NusB [Paracraurococcus sp. LOR1-02]
MAGSKSETGELDRLRAEYEAEQRAAGQPAPAPRPAAAKPGASAARKPAAQRARGRPRTGARVAAVQALFQGEQTGEPAEVVISQFQRHRLGTRPGDGGFEEGRVPEADVPLFSAIVMQVTRNAGEIDATLSSHLDKDWPLVKLDPVLRALLRAACGELLSGKEPPAKVVINEYLDIAHGFFGGDEPRFANGVLDAMARTLRAEEFSGAPRRRGG